VVKPSLRWVDAYVLWGKSVELVPTTRGDECKVLGALNGGVVKMRKGQKPRRRTLVFPHLRHAKPRCRLNSNSAGTGEWEMKRVPAIDTNKRPGERYKQVVSNRLSFLSKGISLRGGTHPENKALGGEGNDNCVQ